MKRRKDEIASGSASAGAARPGGSRRLVRANGCCWSLCWRQASGCELAAVCRTSAVEHFDEGVYASNMYFGAAGVCVSAAAVLCAAAVAGC